MSATRRAEPTPLSEAAGPASINIRGTAARVRGGRDRELMGHHIALTRRGVRRRSTALAIAGTATAVIGAIAITTTAGTAGTAGETGRGGESHRVTLCHATGSRTNPYVTITVDDDAIVRQGHGGHEGPIFSSALAEHEKWGDVVPAFDFGEGARFDGLNWSGAGRALLADDCGAGHGGPTPPGSQPDHTTRPDHTTKPDHTPEPEHPGTKPEHPGTPPPKPSTTVPGAPTTAVATTAGPRTTVAVKGVSETAPPITGMPDTLPITGTRSGLLAGVGTLLLAVGLGLVFLRRRPPA
jgi:hypothetical protein